MTLPKLHAALSVALVALAAPALAAPPGIDTAAKHAVVVDFNTGTTLLDKNADDRMEPASLAKMMTAYVVFDYIKKGQATLEDMLPVSEKAWAKHKTNESNMFVALGSRVKVEDLIRGMIV
jgi:D-alanyl-D-alanine carboxypeptidase (penicillin-binding protein 5/6)